MNAATSTLFNRLEASINAQFAVLRHVVTRTVGEDPSDATCLFVLDALDAGVESMPLVVRNNPELRAVWVDIQNRWAIDIYDAFITYGPQP